MSKQPKDKKDEARDSKETREPSEEPQTEESKTKESKTEEPKAKESKAKGPGRSEDKSAPPPAPKKTEPKKRQKIIMIVMIVLAVIMVIAAALVLLHNRLVQKPTPSPDPNPSVSWSRPSPELSSSSPSSSGDPNPSSSGDPDPGFTQEIITVEPLAGGQRKSEDFFTVLIFGADQISGLTDTIMVASYDVTNNKATVLSIPRDTLVNNYYLDKANKSINATYKQNGTKENGVAALKTEVSRLIGFMPDFYVTIDWELVGQMVDAIGGVYFEIPWRMGYDDPDQNLHIHFEKGYQYLDGKAAMDLVRWRKNNNPGFTTPGGGSDLSRLNLQHDFLKAVLQQTLQPKNIVHIPELITLFNKNVVSDLTLENMLWFGEQAVLKGLSADDVEFLTMPVYGTDNTNARYYGKVCPITNQLLKIVNSSLNPYVEDVTVRQLDLIQMSADGNVLSSTTGTLRNPASGIFNYPDDPKVTDPPEDDPEVTDPPEDDPKVTDPPEDDPEVTDPPETGPGTQDPPETGPGTQDPPETGPGTQDPPETGPGTQDPPETGPGTQDPTESDPVASDPVQSDPEPTQTDDPPPEPGPAETGGDGTDGGDREDTSEQPDT